MRSATRGRAEWACCRLRSEQTVSSHRTLLAAASLHLRGLALYWRSVAVLELYCHAVAVTITTRWCPWAVATDLFSLLALAVILASLSVVIINSRHHIHSQSLPIFLSLVILSPSLSSLLVDFFVRCCSRFSLFTVARAFLRLLLLAKLLLVSCCRPHSSWTIIKQCNAHTTAFSPNKNPMSPQSVFTRHVNVQNTVALPCIPFAVHVLIKRVARLQRGTPWRCTAPS